METNELDVQSTKPDSRISRRALWITLGVLLIAAVALTAAYFTLQATEKRNLEAGREAVAEGNWSEVASSLTKAVDTKPAFIRKHHVEATALRGLAYYQMDRYEAALNDFNTALEQDDKLVDIIGYRAHLHYLQGDKQSALADSESALSHGELLPAFLQAQLFADRAFIFHEDGKTEQVQSEGSEALALNGYLSDETTARLYAVRAISAAESGDDQLAIDEGQFALDQVRFLPPELEAALQMELAYLYHENGFRDLALEAATSGLATGGLDAENETSLHLLQARILQEQGKLSASLAEAQLASSNDENKALVEAIQSLMYYQEGDEEKALEAAEAALALDPDTAAAHRVKGQVLAWQGRQTEAMEAIDKALALNPEDVEALAIRIYLHLEGNDSEKAEADLRAAQKADPAAPATLWAEAVLAVYQEQEHQARLVIDAAINAAEEQGNSRPEYYLWRSYTYRGLGESEQAMADVSKALALNDDFAPALTGRVDILNWQLKYDDDDSLEADLTAIAARYPDWYSSHTHLARFYAYEKDDMEKAMSHADRAIELQPNSTAGYLVRAGLHIQNGDEDLAREDIDKALEIAPDNVDALGALADWHWSREEYEEALALMDDVLAFKPDSARAYLEKAWLYDALGDLAMAWQNVHMSLALDPDSYQALTVRAELYMETWDMDRAQVDLHRVLDAYPNYAWGHYDQARLHYFQGEDEEARAAAEDALAIQPNLVSAYQLLAWIAVDEDDYQAALAYIDRWLEADPEDSYAVYMKGLALGYDGQLEEALANYQEFLSVAEEGEMLIGDAHYHQAMLYLDLADEEMAQEELQSVLDSETYLDTIAMAEEVLAQPGMRATSLGGRRFVEDKKLGYAISFSENWTQLIANPEEGHILSLRIIEEDFVASVDVFVFEGWFTVSLYDLASYLYPADEGARVEPLQEIEISGKRGLFRVYHDEQEQIIGHQYFVASGSRLMVMTARAVEGLYEEFAEEFEAIATSFQFLEE